MSFLYLNNFMAETIQETADRLAAFINQTYADIETGPGSVISELLIKLAASLHNEQYNSILTLSQGNSMQQILAASEDSYSPVMDLIASNYNTTRSGGKKVLGKIKVTTSTPTEYNFFAGLKFVQPALNLTYSLVRDTRVSRNPSDVLAEIQLFENNGAYYFILDVTADEAGPEYQLSSGALFSLADNYYLNSFVKAEAYGNFSSGAAVETDKQLISKIKANLGNTRLDSPAGIYHNLKNTFAGFMSLSVCGANDIEMSRAKNNVLGISTFGKADVYVRTSIAPEVLIIQRAATKVAENTWVLPVSNSDAPGFYHVKSIIPVSPTMNLGGTLVPTSVAFGKATYTGQRCNEVYTDADARFTKYQTATLTFTYADVPSIPINQSALFELHLTHQPNIAEIQDLLLQDQYRLACADYLVKAVVPCMVSLKINLTKKRTTDTFDSLNLQNLKKDLFVYINSIPFGEELQASNIVDICHNYDIKRVDLPIVMTGVILSPDGSTITIEDGDVLVIPSRPEIGVTKKTTQYFIDYYRVDNGTIQPIDNIGINIL